MITMKKNNLETFLAKIRSGNIAIGVCISLTDLSVTEAAADAGYDFCWIDMEHGNLDRNEVMQHIVTLTGSGCAPIVRVSWNEHGLIKSVIDLAPAGILVPMVNTAEEAAKVVSACRYPPLGTRSCGFRRATGYGAFPVEPYMELSEHDPLVIVQIEHKSAVRNLDEILAVPGVDSICIGPYDLSASCGKPGEFNAPEVADMYDEICEKTLKAGKILGAYGCSDFALWKKRSVQWLSITNDIYALADAYKMLLNQANTILNKME